MRVCVPIRRHMRSLLFAFMFVLAPVSLRADTTCVTKHGIKCDSKGCRSEDLKVTVTLKDKKLKECVMAKNGKLNCGDLDFLDQQGLQTRFKDETTIVVISTHSFYRFSSFDKIAFVSTGPCETQ